MGGRGTFAAGNIVSYTYKTIEKIEGIKVLSGLNGKHSLPEEAHKSRAYIKLKLDGTFHEMRIYDADHYLRVEIAYHPEPTIGPKGKPVLHYHTYDKNFVRSKAKKMPKAMKRHFKKYLKGVPL
ncbi:MAG: hypothetical protein IJV62_04490 [Eggerthellaceae bacterium]|nr:hypothetical protein [Eggerthellaceae bacterium]